MPSDRHGAPAGSVPVLRGLVPLPLALGELEERDAHELHELKALILRRIGFDCGGYKEKCLRRRLAVRMRARGVHRYGDYAALLEEDAGEYRRLLDAVTINVSKFFRNPEVWEEVRQTVLPALFALDVPEVRVWSAGCAGGEEPYTLAILLREYAEEHGLRARLPRFRIIATDVDPQALAGARRAVYAPFALTDTSASALERWFDGAPLVTPRPEIRSMVSFESGDLMGRDAPQGLHWIVCRNVVIYFEREVQEALFERFQGALEPGGFLLLGKVEALVGPAAAGFRALRNRERIFQRL
jgi:chemotaxis protein methyltransferase CheR